MTTENFNFFLVKKQRREKTWEEARKQRDQNQKRETEEKWVTTKREYATTAMEKKLRKHWDREIRKEWRNERKEKGEKSKKGWTKGWKEKVIKEKVMIENQEKCWKKKCDTEKGLNRNKKWRFLGWIFSDKKVKREKGLTRNSRKSSKIKG